MTAKEPLSCCITFDFDGMSSWIGSAKSNNPSMISRGEFGAVAIPRILNLLDRYNVTSSFAIPGHTTYAFPNLVKKIHEKGHELVHHGWVHENPADFDETGERHILDQGLEAFRRVLGIRPAGYRSPAWDFSKRTVDLLIEYGFEYDSSCMANDFYPYYLRRGDKWGPDSAYEFGETTELVELPVFWGLDDFPFSEFVMGMTNGLNSPETVKETWAADFDYANTNCKGGLFTLTLHPQTIGRGNRMLLLEQLLEYFTDNEARFETMGAYARRWCKQNPVERWKADNPDLTGEYSINP